MADRLRNLYRRLPPWAQTLAATAHGLRLRRTRYGADLERQVAETLQRDQWSEADWRSWRDERLRAILARAAARVPRYREFWSDPALSRGRDPSRLEDWPLLEKAPLRADPCAYVADDRDPARMVEDHTSGTSGTPLRIWMSRECARRWYAIYEARCRRWHGVSWRDRWVNIGGQLVAPVERRQPPFWTRNLALNQLYMSSYHLAPDLIPHYLDKLARFRPAFLLGYTSSLHALAQGMLSAGRSDVRPKVVITNAEPLDARQRKEMAEAFGCPVRETYGMAELGAAAGDCPSGGLHLWPDVGILEVLDDQGRPVPPGTVGELVVTGLLNDDMPLIRYRVGDRGALLGDDAPPCPCGRKLPRLLGLEGRSDDLLWTADGRRVGRLDPVFKADYPILEAQIVQDSLDCVRVVVVPAPGFDDSAERAIAQKLQERLGPMKIEFQRVDQVPRERNGKFRAVVCRVAR